MQLTEIRDIVIGKVTCDTRLVAFGESHENAGEMRDTASLCISLLRERGFTHLSIECTEDKRPIVEDYLAGTADRIKELSDRGWHGQSWKDLVRAADAAGMSLIYSNSTGTVEERDKFMADKILAVLTNTNNRVAMTAGVAHTSKMPFRLGAGTHKSACAYVCDVLGASAVLSVAQEAAGFRSQIPQTLLVDLPRIITPTNAMELCSPAIPKFIIEELAKFPNCQIRFWHPEEPQQVLIGTPQYWDLILLDSIKKTSALS